MDEDGILESDRTMFANIVYVVAIVLLALVMFNVIFKQGGNIQEAAIKQVVTNLESGIQMIRVQWALEGQPRTIDYSAQVSAKGMLPVEEQMPHRIAVNEFGWPEVNQQKDCEHLWEFILLQSLHIGELSLQTRASKENPGSCEFFVEDLVYISYHSGDGRVEYRIFEQ